MTEIKFCGLTNVEDCLAAVGAGANWLGFNFYRPSPRSVSIPACRAIIAMLRSELGETFEGLHLVGVFVNSEAGVILDTLRECDLHLAQLSGDESFDVIQACGEFAFKAVRAGEGLSLADQVGRLPGRRFPPAVLIDAAAGGQYGGTGWLADWEQARSMASKQPIFLAGGLTPNNAADVVRFVRPWGVDTASGIEIYPGKKDPVKMRAFVEAVREAAFQTEVSK
jgi:phosphoribosylanthranilate isomerase